MRPDIVHTFSEVTYHELAHNILSMSDNLWSNQNQREMIKSAELLHIMSCLVPHYRLHTATYTWLPHKSKLCWFSPGNEVIPQATVGDPKL